MDVSAREGVRDHRTGVALDAASASQATALADFVFGGDHPCVMARSALQRGSVRVGVHEDFGGLAAAVSCHDLYECVLETDARRERFVSYAALFPHASVRDEAQFEQLLWRHLQAMHEVDRHHFGWDPTVAHDPRDRAFSFSIGGCGWYVIGLHPKASRLARRFEIPALVFNPHAQFEQLRAAGRYAALRERIRERDVALQGSVNPMLSDHGVDSEARQYSGRRVDASWRCPFAHHEADAEPAPAAEPRAR